jgi:hypothetical protein
MTMTAKRIVILSLMAAALALPAGCKPKDEAARKSAPVPIEAAKANPGGEAVPLSFKDKSAAAEVSLILPAALARQPDLHARIYSEGVASLRQFSEGAANERAELGEGEGPMQAYERQIEWSVGADTGKLLSVWSLQAEYTGGAHGNSSFNAMLWDKALKRVIAPSALFQAGVDEAMDKALCEALIAEKKRRLEATYQPPSPDTWTCPKWRTLSFALSPSTTPGKAGGLTFLIPPYVAGAYAEGDYRITVPRTAFAGFLKPAYADEFAGDPNATGALAAAQP